MDFESLVLPSFGHVATFAAMRFSTPAGSLVASPSTRSAQSSAWLSLSTAPRRSTPSVRASVRFASVFLPAPQPYRTALPSAQQFGLPLAAARSAALASTRRFAAARQRCRKCNETPRLNFEVQHWLVAKEALLAHRATIFTTGSCVLSDRHLHSCGRRHADTFGPTNHCERRNPRITRSNHHRDSRCVCVSPCD